MNWRTIERWVWYAFVATFAWQTRLIFWQADRTFIEWRSMSLYLSDVLMLALFILALVDGCPSQGQSPPQPPAKGIRPLSLALIILFIFITGTSLAFK